MERRECVVVGGVEWVGGRVEWVDERVRGVSGAGPGDVIGWARNRGLQLPDDWHAGWGGVERDQMIGTRG